MSDSILQVATIKDQDGNANAIEIASNGQVTFSSNTLATHAELYGTNTTGSITNGTTGLTVASASGISDGDFVVAQGIDPGTTVSSGGGTTSITLSANANTTLSSEPVTFYKANKILTTGLTGPMICKAWVNYDSANQNIYSAYNIRSVTRNGTGEIIITFETAFSDENYIIVASAFAFRSNRSASRLVSFQATSSSVYDNAYNTTDCRLRCYQVVNSGIQQADAENIMVAFYR